MKIIGFLIKLGKMAKERESQRAGQTGLRNREKPYRKAVYNMVKYDVKKSRGQSRILPKNTLTRA